MSNVTLVLTGFGRFHGMTDNPTTHIVEAITEMYNNSAPPSVGKFVSRIIVVSATEVTTAANELLELGDDNRIVFLHLGVDAVRDGKFRLELNAFNDASFRAPDEDGCQPDAEQIVKDEEFGNKIVTTLPLESYVEKLTERGYLVETSESAGRFLCNYIYYLMSRVSVNKPNYESLFVHVPSFDDIDRDTQVKFIDELIRLIVD